MDIIEPPSTNEEWNTHSLNIQGIFFQKLIASIIIRHGKVDFVTEEYPVEYPPGNKNIRGLESRLDIHARIKDQIHNSARINLLIECKKANPEFVDWIFFEKSISTERDDQPINFLEVTCDVSEGQPPKPRFDVVSRYLASYKIAGEARETRGDYENYKGGNKTKTSNTAITEAANQVVLATHSIAEEHLEFLGRFEDSKNPVLTHLYLPVIVTTANLFICKFDPQNTSMTTGTISHHNVNLERQDYLFYEYPIPTHLQIKTDEYWYTERPEEKDRYVRRHVLIINGKSFDKILDNLYSRAPHIIAG